MTQFGFVQPRGTRGPGPPGLRRESESAVECSLTRTPMHAPVFFGRQTAFWGKIFFFGTRPKTTCRIANKHYHLYRRFTERLAWISYLYIFRSYKFAIVSLGFRRRELHAGRRLLHARGRRFPGVMRDLGHEPDQVIDRARPGRTTVPYLSGAPSSPDKRRLGPLAAAVRWRLGTSPPSATTFISGGMWVAGALIPQPTPTSMALFPP